MRSSPKPPWGRRQYGNDSRQLPYKFERHESFTSRKIFQHISITNKSRGESKTNILQKVDLTTRFTTFVHDNAGDLLNRPKGSPIGSRLIRSGAIDERHLAHADTTYIFHPISTDTDEGGVHG